MNKKSNSKPNRLIKEKSPYLLQHARNPVQWFPWGEEAFTKAKTEDKPIFLSIGYSTCHWCHVMERESFENTQIADLLNEFFVPIKVDREERPDVDQVYMQAVTAMTGSGGWPMSVFLTSDLKPFYGGTYFPPEDKWGRPGFMTVLNAIREKWISERSHIASAAEELTRALQTGLSKAIDVTASIDQKTINQCFQELSVQFDPQFGGFGHAPKFPRSHVVSWLCRHFRRTKNLQALEMAEKTLTAMLQGGLYDHLGGGFHRYSTDRKWHIPHFEKMLYDQAITARAYLEAYQITKNQTYERVIRETFDYVLRNLTGKEHAFYSAEDADSAVGGANEESEGAFYVWTEHELNEFLDQPHAQLMIYHFGVRPEGNAEEDPHGEFKGKNILSISKSIEETAAHFQLSQEEALRIISEAKCILFEKRKLRPRPHLDDKTLTDWNSLMISSLAFGGKVLNEPCYVNAAEAAAKFILNRMKRADGRLMHRYRDGEVKVEGFLEDYAFFANALLDLYEATFNTDYLKEAKLFTDEMIRLFWDPKSGAFFFTACDQEELITRTKEVYDGAVYSGNSIAALLLLRLGRMLMNENMTEYGMKTIKYFSGQLDTYPSGYTQMMIAFDFLLGPSKEIVIAGDPHSTESQEFVRELYGTFLPNRVVIFHSNLERETDTIKELAPFVKDQIMVNGKTTAYVCENYSCQLPTHDLYQFKKMLEV